MTEGSICRPHQLIEEDARSPAQSLEYRCVYPEAALCAYKRRVHGEHHMVVYMGDAAQIVTHQYELAGYGEQRISYDIILHPV